jgi:prepilin-type N-terminal cleavage/methylation domain-containing protein
MCDRKPRGFTLIELLVVIAINGSCPFAVSSTGGAGISPSCEVLE